MPHTAAGACPRAQGGLPTRCAPRPPAWAPVCRAWWAAPKRSTPCARWGGLAERREGGLGLGVRCVRAPQQLDSFSASGAHSGLPACSSTFRKSMTAKRWAERDGGRAIDARRVRAWCAPFDRPRPIPSSSWSSPCSSRTNWPTAWPRPCAGARRLEGEGREKGREGGGGEGRGWTAPAHPTDHHRQSPCPTPFLTLSMKTAYHQKSG